MLEPLAINFREHAPLGKSLNFFLLSDTASSFFDCVRHTERNPNLNPVHTTEMVTNHGPGKRSKIPCRVCQGPVVH